MNKEQALDLLRQHYVAADTSVAEGRPYCSCGAWLQLGWYDHMAQVLAQATTLVTEPHTAPARSTDPGTSHVASKSINMRAGSQRALLLAAYTWGERHQHARFREGLTDEEAMEVAVEVSPSSGYWKRCAELREAGLIKDTGMTRAGASGLERMVCVITDEGVEWLRRNT
jgi:hypothetical protein